MSTLNKTAPDFGEPWQLTTDFSFDITIRGELAASFDKIEHANRAIACVNACAGMRDPAAEIQALRDAVKEARAFISRMHPSLLNLEHDDYVARYGVSQEYAMSEEAINATLAKLQTLA